MQVTVPLKEVFNQQNIRSLGNYITNAEKILHSSIEAAQQKEYYVLSSAQKRMYFLHKFDPESVAYNMPEILRISGAYDKAQLRDAFNELVMRHENFRTSFEMYNEKPVQRIHETTDFELREYHVAPEKVNEIISSFIRPFDLSKAPLIRVGIIEVDHQEPVLMVDMHHIVSDGVSHSILVSEFMKLYNGDELPPIHLHYKDYAEWQHTDQQQTALNDQKEFWLNEYREEVQAIDLPTDFQRPQTRKLDGDYIDFAIGKNETKRLKALAIKENATMYMVLLSVYNVLLSKLSNQQDIVIGTPTAGRQHSDVDQMIGMFVNTLCLRNYPESALSFQQFLSNVKTNTLACFENQAYQYEQLIDELKVDRDTSRNPLFDVMFSFQNTEQGGIEISGLTFSPFESGNPTSKFDLTLTAREVDDQIHLNFQFATELFEKSTIERFIQYFIRITKTIANDPSTKLGSINVLSDQETEHILVHFNDTRREYPLQETVVSLFEKSVRKTPDRKALIHGDTVMTYNEMHQKVEEIAAYLHHTLGVKKGDLVGLLLDRDEKLVQTIFAILRIGAAYVPIDTRAPKDRVLSIIHEAGLQLLITRNNAYELFASSEIRLVDIDDLFDEIMDHTIEVPAIDVQNSDLAYVLYTSGSTGKPKGVAIEHSSLINLVQYMQEIYPLLENDSYLFKTTYSFDVSVAELFGWFLAGGSLTVLETGTELDSQRMLETIAAKGITHINFVPSMFNVFLETIKELSLIHI